MSYKETLFLPKTDFPMHIKGKVCKPDSYRVADPYLLMQEIAIHRSSPEFSLHDGPPYANGDIHIGHALNKILKDFLVKANHVAGHNVDYTPGWDCHGLPIERKVSAQGPFETVQQLREACRAYADSQVDKQREQFKRLGVVADWDNAYKTMDRVTEAFIYGALCDLAKQGLIERKLKPVLWSWAEKTALAEAEVVYKEKKDNSVYVHFLLEGHKHLGFLVWTTTPWTLPSNVAIAFNPNEKYALVLATSGKKFIVAANCVETLHQKGVFGNDALIAEPFDIRDYKQPNRHIACNPINDGHVGLVPADFVTTDSGTGLVHIAPGHGKDDYFLGVKEKLPMLMPVDESGKYTQEVRSHVDLVGLHVFDGNKKLVEYMREKEALIFEEQIVHEYPYCWRSDTPVIFRATPNWFINLEKIRPAVLAALETIEFTPPSGKEKLRKMIEERDEWCISRQRAWGVPIAFFVKDGKPNFDEALLDHTTEIFSRYGCDCWWFAENNYFLPPSLHYHDVGERCFDTLDVWFDSGLTWKTLDGATADVYLEGSDQYRGWFQSSLLLSVALTGEAPCKRVISHGFVIDDKGHKMSKSIGNTISPMEIIDEYGADVLRIWAATIDYTDDVKIGVETASRAKDLYQKIRNTLRFCVANIGDYDEHPAHFNLKDGLPIDGWIASKSCKVCSDAHEHFLKAEFHVGMRLLTDFIIDDVSGLYMNAIKDRMYCEAKTSQARESAVVALCYVLENLVSALLPIITFTIDEIYPHLPAYLRKQHNTIWTIPWPMEGAYADESFDESFWKQVHHQFHSTFDQLKRDEVVKDLLDLVVSCDKPFNQDGDILGVSLLGFDLDDTLLFGHKPLAIFEVAGNAFKVYKSNLQKCPRCWRRLAHAEGELCDRCKTVVQHAIN